MQAEHQQAVFGPGLVERRLESETARAGLERILEPNLPFADSLKADAHIGNAGDAVGQRPVARVFRNGEHLARQPVVAAGGAQAAGGAVAERQVQDHLG